MRRLRTLANVQPDCRWPAAGYAGKVPKTKACRESKAPVLTKYRGAPIEVTFDAGIKVTKVSPLPLSIRATLLICLLLCAGSVCAQDRPPESVTTPESGGWTPMGRLPADQAGAGLRGYALPGESTEVADPGASQISIHAVAANNFYREQTSALSISQRFETHTLALGYRRGFKVGTFPRFELGGQFQLIEGDNGFMNGFISGSENFLAWLTGQESARNPFRRNGTPPPLGTLVTKGGQPVYQAAGDGRGFGDFSLVAKAMLRDGDASSSRARLAVRAGVSVSGKSEFTQGNFAGIGMSLDRKVLPWAAFHGDVRASFPLERVSRLNLPLKAASLGFSAGPELRIAKNSSASIQLDGNTTPYLATGTAAFDRGYGDVTLGVGHRFGGSRRQAVAQAYLRENLNLPFRVRWNTDPDLSLGFKVTIRSAAR